MRIRSLTILLLMLFLSTNMMGQEANRLDSLYQQLESTSSDIEKVDILNAIAADLLYYNSDKILEYAEQALNLSTKNNYSIGIAEAYNNMGIYYRTLGLYNRAIDYFFNSLEIMKQLNNTRGIGRSYNLIGIIYYYLGNYNLSLQYYQKAIEINLEQKDKKWLAANLNNVGMIYEKQGKFDEALENYLYSLEINTELENTNWIGNNYSNIGSLYLKMDNHLSLEYFTKRLEITKAIGDALGLSVSYYKIGQYYLHFSNFREALPYLTRSYKYAKEAKSLKDLNDASEKLSYCFEQLEEYDSAYYYHTEFKTYSDSLKITSSTEKITRLVMQNNFERQLHVAELEYEKKKYRFTIAGLALFFTVIVVAVLYFRQRLRSKRTKLLQDNLKLENHRLHEDLNFKKNMLEDNINYLLDKNELIGRVIEQLNIVLEKADDKNLPVIRELLFELKSDSEDDIQEEFELRFSEIHNNFYDELNKQYPNLTANEIKLCAFINLGLKTKEISAITKQSIKSIETARSRLRKKLNIEDASISLNEFLKNL